MEKELKYLLLVVMLILLLAVSCSQTPATSRPGTTPPQGSTPSRSPTGNPTQTEIPSASNGERIYISSISASGQPITYSGGPGMMMQAGLACVNCHGPGGHGGPVFFMMQTVDVPDITWPELTGQHMDHPPYTVETVKRAITEGLDPAGNTLKYPMPRWQMSDRDMNDLITYLETLK